MSDERAHVRVGAILGALLAASALAACGLAAGSAPSAVQLLVTRDFGGRVLARASGLRARDGETVLDLLSGGETVTASSQGDGVASIDGLWSGPQAHRAESETQWLYYVNGVQAPRRAAATAVHPGDHIWWDLHDASQSPRTPAAIVGAFPEPFLNGIEGKRLPVRVECTLVAGYACRAVTASLRRFGVPAAIAQVGSGGAPETLRVIVGPWVRIASDLEAQSIARGPRASGVYARFSDGGRELTLLDAQGRPAGTLGADTGLVAATQGAREAPVWVVTGTEGAGVNLAARAFDRSTLKDRFAVALTPAGAVPLPASGA